MSTKVRWGPKVARLGVLLFVLGGMIAQSLPAIASPANDSFADATAILAFPFSDNTNTGSATFEEGEPTSCTVDPIGHTVWYRFTPTVDGTLAADTFGSNFDTVLAVYTGSNFGNLAQIACNDDSDSTTNQSSVTIAVLTAATYYLQVAGLNGGSGDLQFSARDVQEEVIPANDNFADATEVSGMPFNVDLRTDAATTQEGESKPCDMGSATVWYRFVPSSDLAIVADTFGSDFDTVLAAYSGTNLADLTELGCNDQSNGDQSRVDLNLMAGETYYFQIAEWSGSESAGALRFNLRLSDPPVNDDFANATAISAVPFTDTINTQDATLENGEPTCVGVEAEDSVWYKFTPSQNTTIRADTNGTDFWAVIAVHKGDVLDHLTSVDCNVDEITTQVSAGTTYYFQVGGLFDKGDITFNLQAISLIRSETQKYLAGNSAAVECNFPGGNLGQVGGACFDLTGAEFQASVAISDVAGLPVGAYWEFKSSSGLVLSSGDLLGSAICGTRDLAVPSGATQLQIWVDGPLGPVHCDKSAVGAGTSGTITARLFAFNS